jgi:hypothetical protein
VVCMMGFCYIYKIFVTTTVDLMGIELESADSD